MPWSAHVCASMPIPFSPLLHPQAVLPIDCITCTAPVWLSLAAWWSFLAGYEDQSDFLAPTFKAHPPAPSSSQGSLHCSLLLFFPDCNASVHKGCRDSLPVCAKVKMKVRLLQPTAEPLTPLSCSQYPCPSHFCFDSLFLCSVAQTAAYSIRFKHPSYSHNEEQM